MRTLYYNSFCNFVAKGIKNKENLSEYFRVKLIKTHYVANSLSCKK